MATGIHRFLFLLVIIPILACGVSKKSPKTLPISSWVLTNPRSYNLGIPENFFEGKILSSPHVSTCHTQGLAIVDDQIFISCCLYNAREKRGRTYASASFLLKAPLSKILRAHSKSLPWTLKNLTKEVPASEQKRITYKLLNLLPSSLSHVISWLFPLEEIRHVMGHPSGIFYDRNRGGIWLANSVYTQNSYSHLLLIDPKTLEPLREPIALQQHLGLLAPVHKKFIWGGDWGGKKRRLTIIQPESRTESERMFFVKMNPSLSGYESCTLLDDSQEYESTLLCGGNLKDDEMKFLVKRQGILHLVTASEENPSYPMIVATENILRTTSSHQPLVDLGVRSFTSVESVGDVEFGPLNNYGGFKTQKTLTNGGLAVSEDKKYVYFLPDDIPGSKLVRFELKKRQEL